MTNETPALGICLEEYEYPYPVQFLPLSNDLQPLKMAYMDIPPATEPNGRTVVLLHGKAFGCYYFRNVIEALTGAGYRVIAADQIGWGKSSKPDVHYSFQLLAANTAALLDHLGVQQVAVLGHSTGGMTAARFTLMNPGRVTHLVLEDPLGLADYRTGIPPQSEETLFNASPRLKPGDFWLRRDPARSPGREEGGMSYVVGTSQDALTLDQDYPGGIPVAVCGVTAVLATEGSFGQLEWQLVSRKTLRAGHSGVGGRNRHHLPARPLAVPVSVRLRAPTVESAALRAMSDFARNFGLKSSTAITSWPATTRCAHTRPSCVFCRAAFFSNRAA